MICGLLTPDGGGGTCLGLDLVRERDAIKRQTGYMTQRFSPLRGPDHPREPRIRRAASTASTGAASGSTRRSSGSGLADAPAAARRRAVGRLEAAAGAGRLRAARAQAAAARRAHRRRRSQGAARLLGRDPRLRRRGHHRAGLDPLHGRGRALPRDRLHRLWRADGARHGRRRSSSSPAWSPSSRAGPAPTGWRASCATQARRRRPPPPSARRCTSAAPTARALEARHRAVPQARRIDWRGRADARGRVHPPDGPGAGQHGGGMTRTVARAGVWRRCIDQGGAAAPPRPADLRHDVRRADHAAAAVRLRHQHRSAPSADRRAGRGPTSDDRPHRSSSALANTGYIRPSPSGRARRPRPTRCCSSGEVQFVGHHPVRLHPPAGARRARADADRGRRHRSARRPPIRWPRAAPPIDQALARDLIGPLAAARAKAERRRGGGAAPLQSRGHHAATTSCPACWR